MHLLSGWIVARAVRTGDPSCGQNSIQPGHLFAGHVPASLTAQARPCNSSPDRVQTPVYADKCRVTGLAGCGAARHACPLSRSPPVAGSYRRVVVVFGISWPIRDRSSMVADEARPREIQLVRRRHLDPTRSTSCWSRASRTLSDDSARGAALRPNACRASRHAPSQGSACGRAQAARRSQGRPRPRSSAHAAAPTRDRALGYSNAREARETIAPASRHRIGVEEMAA